MFCKKVQKEQKLLLRDLDLSLFCYFVRLLIVFYFLLHTKEKVIINQINNVSFIKKSAIKYVPQKIRFNKDIFTTKEKKKTSPRSDKAPVIKYLLDHEPIPVRTKRKTQLSIKKIRNPTHQLISKFCIGELESSPTSGLRNGDFCIDLRYIKFFDLTCYRGESLVALVSNLVQSTQLFYFQVGKKVGPGVKKEISLSQIKNTGFYSI